MTITNRNNLLRYLQFIGFAIIAVALPFSNFLMSFGMFWLCGVLLLQLINDATLKVPFAHRWKRFTSNSTALALIALYALPIIGLLWTQNMDYALWDLRMKLPILVLPLLISLVNPLTQGEFRALIGLFLLAVLIAVMWCLQVYWLGSPEIDRDVRQISVFISHVRFSLLIVLALGLLVRFAHGSAQGKVLIVLFSLPCLYFIYIIGSITGTLVLMALVAWMGLRYSFSQEKRWKRYALPIMILVVFTGASAYLVHSYKRYFMVEFTDWNALEKTTPRGELYDHHPTFPFIEDGHYVMTYVAWGELYDTWNSRSALHPDSLDGRGHIVKGTLIRYLASKSLRKDADGVRALTNEDIVAIEAGAPTCTEMDERGLEKRLNRIFFEWSNYRAGGDPDGHSVIQRWEFWKTAVWIIKQHVWIGVGTGDVKDAFQSAYTMNDSPLDKTYRLRAHNQYLTMWVTYGLFGLIAFTTIVFWPVLKDKRRDSLTIMIVLLVSLSYLTEDTLESQAGVMFMAFFYMLFTSKRAVSLAELRRPKSKEKHPSSDAPTRK
jgi:hypothetical protein